MTRNYSADSSLELRQRRGRLDSEILFIVTRYDSGALPPGVYAVIAKLKSERDAVATLLASSPEQGS